ncbi:DUF4153 domain-containing protein [Niabella hibiscisoli]|uniref:DUF4153 domain-containing protein n=1 Tax=Niabella hibiscisoli TaxID=1825928 RepID=UPI001F116DE4|nr:DUF4153 domain-containing protein [Niabella hibiscisoli]MCH5715014.1 DUF4173 domain-containing protein [Niabella hibiscisoli]
MPTVLLLKRIGVFIFLLLSLFGLFATWVKLKSKKTNIFLINRMIWAAFYVLVISSFINWSWIVTKYNTRHFANPDWQYLESLDYNKALLNRIYIEKGMDRKTLVEGVYKRQPQPFLSTSLYWLTLSL